jgi:hypothetical protein
MRAISAIATMTLLGVLVGGCSVKQAPEIQDQGPRRIDSDMDGQLAKVADRLPGFGGMFFDDNGDLNVYLVAADAPADTQALEARKARVETAITAVFGKDLLVQGRDRRSEPGSQAMPERSPEIKIIKGKYDIPQLVEWRAGVDLALEVRGVLFTDLDERHNRVRVGVESSVVRERVEAILARRGIPREAVIIEQTKPDRFHATLRDERRPVQGGVQIEADTGIFSSKICTLGFNAFRNNVKGFVTNSHCTENQGGSDGTDFHQPTDPLFGSNKIGDEIADPPYFTGGICPAGRRCRFSDSAFVDYSEVLSGGARIVRTTGTGSLTIHSTNPTFLVISETATPVDGTILDKVGRTTGWTSGRVSATCLTTNVADTNITLFCQNRVARISGTNRMSDNGDSGSPVFRVLGSDASLFGILWGGPDDGSSFVFSSISRIEGELGSLTTFDFPTPGPGPRQCPVGQRCCGSVSPDGTCDGQCWPANRPCP